jgi:hypothetical protein
MNLRIGSVIVIVTVAVLSTACDDVEEKPEPKEAVASKFIGCGIGGCDPNGRSEGGDPRQSESGRSPPAQNGGDPWPREDGRRHNDSRDQYDDAQNQNRERDYPQPPPSGGAEPPPGETDYY